MSLSIEDIKNFPKAELHRHLDGAVPKEVVRRLALRHGIHKFQTRTGTVVPVDDEPAFDRFYQIHNVPSVDEMLARFDIVLTVMQTPENIEEVFYEATLDVARKNIWYVEWTMAPAYHTREGLDLHEVVSSALRGLRRGKKDTGVLGKLILAIQREATDKQNPEDTRDPSGLGIARTAIEFQDDGVVALGLVGDEFSYAPEIYEEAFSMTEGTRIKRVVHAGEMGEFRERHVETAIKKLGADRIGHGIPVGKNPTLGELLKSHTIGLEINPLSNVLLGMISSIGELNIDKLLASGIRVSLNSDDPILLQKELVDNIKTVFDVYGWGEKELVKFTQNALDSACMTPDERKERLAFFKSRGFDG